MNTTKNKTINSQDLLVFEELGIKVPSCNKCYEACNGCKVRFIQKLY